MKSGDKQEEWNRLLSRIRFDATPIHYIHLKSVSNENVKEWAFNELCALYEQATVLKIQEQQSFEKLLEVISYCAVNLKNHKTAVWLHSVAEVADLGEL